MSRSAAPAALVALFALTGCFRYTPQDCQVLCDLSVNPAPCPGEMQCLRQPSLSGGIGLCAAQGTMCEGPVSDSGVGPTDSGTHDGGDAGGPQAPTMLCHNGRCFTLPDSVRSNLVLLLWPSNLPPVGSTVSLWADQSGQGNDAHALDSTAPPEVIPDGVRLDSTQTGAGLVVTDSPTLDFAANDFAILAVVGLSSPTTPLSIARKSDVARTNSRQISIDWVLSAGDGGRSGELQGVIDETNIPATSSVAQPSVTAYTLYRSADHVELHVNGSVFGSADLPTGTSTTNAAALYIGVSGMYGTPADSVEAVVAVRGPIESTILKQLEVFLRDVFAKSAP